MELVEVARALYSLPPEEFTAARTARSREARAAGDRDLAAQVAALRKPSAAAWTVDRLVRTDPARVRALLDLGRRMARAQEDLAGGDLRTLGREQHRLLGETRAAVLADAAAAGRTVTDAVLGQVEQTLRAAMADVGAAAAVGTALLTTHLTSTGFEAVDVEGAVGVARAASLLDDDGGAPAAPGPPASTSTSSAPARSSPAEPRPAQDDDVVTLRGARPAGRVSAASADAAAPGSASPRDDAVILRGARGARGVRAGAGAQRAEAEREAQRRAEAERREQGRREQARRDEAAEALAAASEAAERARAALEAASDAARVEAEREAALAAEVDAAADRLADLQQQHAAARVAHRHAEAARRTAARDATTAARRVEATRERLERS